jgi:hypothetical protein
LSASGKYIVCACAQYHGLRTSSDYGVTWGAEKNISAWIWNDVAMALDGSIMYACTGDNASNANIVVKSVDYGESWSTVHTSSGPSVAYKNVVCSGDGKYVLVSHSSSAQLLFLSNYGSSFSSVGTSATYYSIAMSKNGLYMVASVNGSGLHYSSDMGANWDYLANNSFVTVCASYNCDVMYNVRTYNIPFVYNHSEQVIIKTSAPFIATQGSSYFDVDTSTLKIYNGSSWIHINNQV